MIFEYETLKLIWWMLVGALLIGFAIADGMDMGVGNLLPFLGRNDAERRVIINTVAPHWDGNQVWLITAGGAIFAAWPFVYAAAFSGLYMALLLVLFALFFRPVGFDYRSKIADARWRNVWDWAIFAGGAIPSLIFGVAFGNLLQGLPFHLDNLLMVHYEKSFIFALLPLLNPFALLAGVISFSMLTMHGALWLQLRTEGDISSRARNMVIYLSLVTAIGFAIAGLWVAFGMDGFRILTQPPANAMPNPLGKTVVIASGAWLDIYSHCPAALLAPICGFLGVILAALFSRRHRPGLGFIANGLSMAGIIGTAGLSMFPFVMPSSTNPNSSLTMWDATSSHLTLTIMFWAVALFLPIVLAYTAWCYKRMWGKVTAQGILKNTHASY
jgi:cytochrome bd ubiquinol oxidase subunit II